ncbi:MAG: hypothetical protein Q3962_07980, partial [Corynebacterium sp.]|nr:hypothetical protein [Corynebacterium sp.]
GSNVSATKALTVYGKLGVSVDSTTVNAGGSVTATVTGLADGEAPVFKLVPSAGGDAKTVTGTAVTGEAGKYTLAVSADVATGVYTLTVTGDKDRVDANASASVENVSVLGGLAVDTDSDAVAAGKSVTATVTGLSANEGLKFTLTPKAGGTAREVAGTAVTGEAGKYTVDVPADVATGSYDLTVAGGSTDRQGSNVSATKALTVYGKLGVNADKTAVVGGSVKATVSGLATDETPSFAFVNDGGSTDVPAGNVTKYDDGSFTVKLPDELKAGSYNLTVNGTHDRVSANAPATSEVKVYDTLGVTANDSVAVGGSLTATVTGADANETLSFKLVSTDGGAATDVTASSAGDGKYTIKLPESVGAGAYKLTVSGAVDRSATADVKVVKPSVAVDDSKVTTGGSMVVTVANLGDSTPTFTLEKDGKKTTVTGTAVDGQPGKYTIVLGDDIEPGEYTLNVVAGGLTSTANVTVEAKATSEPGDNGNDNQQNPGDNQKPSGSAGSARSHWFWIILVAILGLIGAGVAQAQQMGLLPPPAQQQ